MPTLGLLGCSASSPGLAGGHVLLGDADLDDVAHEVVGGGRRHPQLVVAAHRGGEVLAVDLVGDHGVASDDVAERKRLLGPVGAHEGDGVRPVGGVGALDEVGHRDALDVGVDDGLAVGGVAAAGAGHVLVDALLGGHLIDGRGERVVDVARHRDLPLERVDLGEVGRGAAQRRSGAAERACDSGVGGVGRLVPGERALEGVGLHDDGRERLGGLRLHVGDVAGGLCGVRDVGGQGGRRAAECQGGCGDAPECDALVVFHGISLGPS